MDYDHRVDQLRAECANSAEKLVAGYCGAGDDLEASIIDVMTDIRHLCAVKGFDWCRVVDLAERNFEAEVSGG